MIWCETGSSGGNRFAVGPVRVVHPRTGIDIDTKLAGFRIEGRRLGIDQAIYLPDRLVAGNTNGDDCNL